MNIFVSLATLIILTYMRWWVELAIVDGKDWQVPWMELILARWAMSFPITHY
jgi:hypothetical protein